MGKRGRTVLDFVDCLSLLASALLRSCHMRQYRLSGANGADLAPMGICETKEFIYSGFIQEQGGGMVSVFDVAEYVLSEVG